MWWKQLEENARALDGLKAEVHPTASVDPTATVVGQVTIGPGSKICAGACIQGPVRIGADCFIGNNSMIRGPIFLEDGVRIGFSTEMKNAILRRGVSIGHLGYVADSILEEGVFFGGLVRTSNYRLDGKTVSVLHDGKLIDTGLLKLGAHIGAHASLGSMVVILPGRIVASGSLFGPRITIEKNLPAARYMLKQELSATEL